MVQSADRRIPKVGYILCHQLVVQDVFQTQQRVIIKDNFEDASCL